MIERIYKTHGLYASYTLKPNLDVDEGYKGGAYFTVDDGDSKRETFIEPEALAGLAIMFKEAAGL